METVKIWSAGHGDFIEFTISDEFLGDRPEISKDLVEAVRAFVEENKDGDFFSAFEIDELSDNEEVDALFTNHELDTASFVAAFCPAGFGVCQHGHDDFAIEPVGAGESE